MTDMAASSSSMAGLGGSDLYVAMISCMVSVLEFDEAMDVFLV